MKRLTESVLPACICLLFTVFITSSVCVGVEMQHLRMARVHTPRNSNSNPRCTLSPPSVGLDLLRPFMALN